jgi:translocation and assembly module TamB
MAVLPPATPAPAPAFAPPRWRRIITGLVGAPLLLAALVLAALVAGLVWLDSNAGHAFLLRRLAGLELESGLSVRADAIEGSIYGRTRIRGLVVADPAGGFANAPAVVLDWRPWDLLRKRFTAAEISADQLTITRRPRLRDTQDDRILPNFDIIIGRLRLQRIDLAAGVAGARAQRLALAGGADIRAGRALVDLIATAAPGADRLTLHLDSRPDDDVFELDALIDGPRGGAIAGLAGVAGPVAARITGDGGWQRWQGRISASLEGEAIAALDLTNRAGRYGLSGSVTAGRWLPPRLASLADPLRLEASAATGDGPAAITLSATSAALSLAGSTTVDFADEDIEAGTITLRLLRPALVDKALAGEAIIARARLAGTLAAPKADIRLTADRIGWGTYGVRDLVATGLLDAGQRPLSVPIDLKVAGVIGLPAAATPLLAGARLDGIVGWANGELTARKLVLSGRGLAATGSLAVRPGNGRWQLITDARLPSYLIDGLGAADVAGRLVVGPGPGGALITGPITLKLARAENSTLARLAEGPLQLAGQLLADGTGRAAVNGLVLAAPGFALKGSASLAGGAITVNAGGTTRMFGPVQLAATGTLAKPAVRVELPRPGYGLSNVVASVDGGAAGWQLAVAGGSPAGPFKATGLIVSGSGPLAISVDTLAIAGLNGQGRLEQTADGPFAGRIALGGGGLNGEAVLDDASGVQRIRLLGRGRVATLALATPVAVESADLDLTILLPPEGPQAKGTLALTGIERGTLWLEQVDATLAWAAGRGDARFSLKGQSDAPFALAGNVVLAGDVITIAADGNYDGRPLRLAAPATLTRVADGWRLAPATLTTGEGSATLSGLYGDRQSWQARFDKLSLGLVSAVYPAIDLAGRLSGTLDITVDEGGAPRGIAALRVNGLSRTGVATSSRPIELGVNANLAPQGSIVKAVVVRAGAVEGRVQARLGAVPDGSEPFIDRVFQAPITAQVRYNGAAQDIWLLIGLQALDIRGDVAASIDVTGVLGDPQLSGSLRAENARVESPIIGAVVTDGRAVGRFAGSRLELTGFTAKSGPNGSITGRGNIDLSFERGFPVDLRMVVKNAVLLDRDDLDANASGSIRVATDEYGGVVSGTLTVDKGTFHIGRTAVADVPVLAVTERNVRALGRRATLYAPPTRWLFNLGIKANSRLYVEGMGIQSEWQADLRLRGGATTPELLGRVQLVRGDYDFAGRRFVLTRGDIRFQGVYPPDPVIAITAENVSSSLTALLTIDGTAQRPNIHFSSVPALPEDEVLSRVLFGTSVTDLSAPEAVQLAGALSSLRGGGFNPIGAVRKGLGLDRLRILPADVAIGRGAAVAAGRYIGRNVYVEFATDAQGYTATSIEIGLTRSLSLLSSVATLGGTSASVRWKRDY